jgi:hypothetical protein
MSAGIFNNVKPRTVYYCKGYKYQLARDYIIQMDLEHPDIITDYIIFSKGLMTIRKGYAWDGCSGPTYDDNTNMRGGLVHDAGYQLIRLGLLAHKNKEFFDKLLRTICLEDGMWKIRAWYYFEGVDHFAKFATRGEPYPVLTAP